MKMTTHFMNEDGTWQTNEIELSADVSAELEKLQESMADVQWCECEGDTERVYFDLRTDEAPDPPQDFGWSHGWSCATCEGLVQGG